MFTSLTTITKTASLVGAVAALSIGAGVGAASAASSPHTTRTVPPIRESFTYAPCPANASSTVDLETCAGDKVITLDRRIDALDNRIVAKLPAGGQAKFIAAAKAWLDYRGTVAQAAASPESGGSIAPVVELGAMQQEDSAHITALTREFTSMTGQKP